MTDMLNNVKIDLVKVNEGVWRKVFRSELLIAHVSNDKFKQAIMNLAAVQMTEEALIRIMAKTILLGWRNVKDPQGNELIYTEELAVIALTDSDDIRSFVDKVSTDLQYYCE